MALAALRDSAKLNSRAVELALVTILGAFLVYGTG